MEIMKFIETIVASIAWPFSIIIIVWLLKKDLGQLLSRIKRIKHKDSEIELQQGIEDAAKQADKNNLPRLENKDKQERIYRLAMDSPRGAILDAWLEVEETLNSYCKRKGINEHIKSPMQLIQSIYMHDLDYNYIGKGLFDMLYKLKNLRNEAVHISDHEISTKTAIEYAKLAKRVIAKFEEA
ncbi:MAG: hypothetical protein R3331_10835 [Sulfurospirillaceae bacterium]|nr:hypothetical protein [Sulfurospirillaceae bacterium]